MYDIAWLQGKTAFECASTSTDGQVLWWDIRKLGEPSDSLTLEDKADGRKMGGVSMEYSAAAGPTKFLVGTEQGKVVSCNRKAKNPADRLGTVYEGHCGPVYALQRNPFFPKYFMTIGDWTVRSRCDLDAISAPRDAGATPPCRAARRPPSLLTQFSKRRCGCGTRTFARRS